MSMGMSMSMDMSMSMTMSMTMAMTHAFFVHICAQTSRVSRRLGAH